MGIESNQMPFHVLLVPTHHILSSIPNPESSIFFLVPLILSSLLFFSVYKHKHTFNTLKNVPPIPLPFFLYRKKIFKQ